MTSDYRLYRAVMLVLFAVTMALAWLGMWYEESRQRENTARVEAGQEVRK